MKEDMDHERCSELLGSYARAELDERQRDAVEVHLESCSECRLEVIVVEALSADEAGLDPRERRKLHAAVAREIEPREPVVIGRGLARSGWARRFAPTLSAAALLLLVVIVGLSGLTGNGGEDGGDAASGGAGRSTAGAPQRDRQKDGSGDQAEGGEAPASEELDEEASFKRGRPKPEFGPGEGPRLTSRSQWRTAVAGTLLRRYAASYTTDDAVEQEDRYLALLADSAPSEVRSQVTTCGDEVRARTSEPVLAAYGTLATVEEEKGLLLSFAYSESAGEPLSDYVVWAWPLGSCSSPLGFTTGKVDE